MELILQPCQFPDGAEPAPAQTFAFSCLRACPAFQAKRFSPGTARDA